MEMEDYQDISVEEFSRLVAQTPTGGDWRWCRKMHKVPEELRSQNEHVFNPVMVSLGPYHHGKAELSRGERFKYICLDWCSKGDVSRKTELYNVILRNIGEIKSCYADEDETFAKFADDKAVALMMLLDACFILNFMENTLHRVTVEQRNIDIPNTNNNIPATNNYFPYKHNIEDWVGFLGLASSIRSATRDIILLENQVPFMVISLLMISLYDISMRGLLLAWFFNWTTAYGQQTRLNIIPGADQEAPIHLLEACWRVLVMNEDNIASIRAPLNTLTSADKVYTNRSVMNLKAMGIQFRRSNSHFLKDISFRSGFIRGHLLIPFRNISSWTPVMYSNLIAYEVSPGNGTEHVVLCYINLMKSLVQTPEDMQELQRQGIMMNKFANDEQAVQAIKEINMFALTRFNTFAYVRQGIDTHCRNRRKTLLVNLYYTNFQTPWSGIGFLAAVLLLFLASVQTYFTVFPKK